jgi:hypothetical protein
MKIDVPAGRDASGHSDAGHRRPPGDAMPALLERHGNLEATVCPAHGSGVSHACLRAERGLGLRACGTRAIQRMPRDTKETATHSCG